MKRRNFLGVLASVPFLGFLAPKHVLPKEGWSCQARTVDKIRAYFTFTPAREEIRELNGRVCSVQVGKQHVIQMDLEEQEGNKYTYRYIVPIEEWETAEFQKDYKNMLHEVCMNPIKYFRMADHKDLGERKNHFTFGRIKMELRGFVKKSGECMWSIGGMEVTS